MGIASVFLGGFLCLAAMTNGMACPWYGVLLASLVCLAGPLSVLLINQTGSWPTVVISVAVYGLSVIWLRRKPSRAAKVVFFLLSCLWLFLGFVVASVGI
jgi:hypothetical protein